MNPATSHSPLSGVIVTGGASGIGLASAEALAAAGRPVAIWDLRAADAARVAHDMTDVNPFEEKEKETTALEQQALAVGLSAQGVQA